MSFVVSPQPSLLLMLLMLLMEDSNHSGSLAILTRIKISKYREKLKRIISD